MLLGVPNGNGASLPRMLEPVVDELRAAVGDLDFSVIDTASLVTMSGEESFSGSETLEIVQRLTINGDSLNGNIFVGHEQQELAMACVALLAVGIFFVRSEPGDVTMPEVPADSLGADTPRGA